MAKYMVPILLLFTAALHAQTDKFIGNWANGDESLTVEIYIQNGNYYAKAVKSEHPELIGKVVLVQMEKKSDTQLYGGTYYDEKLKTEYEAKLKIILPDTIRLTVMYGLFHKTIYWHRIFL
ncbi:MAG: hypothetical protein CFE23_11295 [Flavobacterium sp. BFFFF1]|uniref:DUF2147 domain-containing protein n=1 Tax=unclassified Flavobacterium TaxID=196869 RepID=UPI000BC788F8|nr:MULTISPECIES: DUF2147 domain-containing protein [unclassified Flavobacterium]OYU79969.1 MAG: hypothetical protein CFE23_11295 [Flavobacterium sp. BFFFF1]